MIDQHTATETTAAADWFVDRVAAVLSTDRGPVKPALAERAAAAGQMPPLTVRYENETYRVTEGVVTFFVGDETVTAITGDVVVAPAGSERTFRVESERARWLVLTHVRSLPRFEDFGRAVSAPVESWPSLEEAASVASIARTNGIELLGPPGTLPLPG